MAKQQTVHLENTHVTANPVLHLTEAVYISAEPIDRKPLVPLQSGGGGPGYGGWGMDAGQPRGTSLSKSQIGKELAWRRIYGEEQLTIMRIHARHYAPLLKQLSAQIASERANIEQQAIEFGGSRAQIVGKQQKLSILSIQQKRIDYLQTLPQAVSFYGAIPFFKRYDSFSTRMNDPGAFPGHLTRQGAKKLWTTFDASVDAAYKLHLQAEKIQALANDLPTLARQLDHAELQEQPTNLPTIITRRAAQILLERQICFDCLPSLLQHELVELTKHEKPSKLEQNLAVSLTAAGKLINLKRSQVPPFKERNSKIKSPLSKPEVEALLHLVDDQAKRRAGQLWKDYHRALALNESIRYLQQFSAALTALRQRALEVERLQVQHADSLKQKQEAERKAREIAQKAQAERRAKEAAQKAEAARKAKEVAQKAEAERKAKDAAQKAEAQRRELADAERRRTSYNAIGSTSASLPLILPLGPATFAISQAAYTALQTATRAAVANIAVSVVPAIGRALIATLSLAWPSTLGNSERRYLISVPLSDLSPPGGPNLSALAMTSKSIDLPYLLTATETAEELSLYVESGGRAIPVRAAGFDSERQLYTVALDNPQRFLTWTPASAPGSEHGSSTSLLPVPPGTIVYSGSSLNPVISEQEQEQYPALDLDQERLIVTFPLDSGLPPILVVFKSPRFEPGVAVGQTPQVSGAWPGETARVEGAPIPAHIADLLRGVDFKNFDGFRTRLWKAVANDPELSKQFDERSLQRMKKFGYAPLVPDSEIYMSQAAYVLHHTVPISEGGGVYDMNNIRIVTPRSHNKIHYGGKE
ncbi:S-type pyocin domain-containing protein [Pseudomonas urmiensis]|uniref:S-type pyocin domain-containing protein n=1 Tax=Pseudomonas urmiensis TaxID=2745493 RepID=A0ABW8NYC3_9PSED